MNTSAIQTNHPEQFAKYRTNPENFIVQISNLINGVKEQNTSSQVFITNDQIG